MYMNPFAWIRNRVRASALAGFADALALIDSGDVALDSAIPTALVERLTLPALPASAPVETEPEANGKRRKAVTS